jgi:hypothetical protein
MMRVFESRVRSSSNTAVRADAQLGLHNFAKSGLAVVKPQGLQLGSAGPASHYPFTFLCKCLCGCRVVFTLDKTFLRC